MAVGLQLTRNGTLVSLVERLGNLEPLFASIAAFAESAVVLGFNQGIDPYTDPWEPLADETIDRKGSAAPLIDTGNMLGSVNSSSSATTAVVGIGAEYARFHQEGTFAIPQRMMIPRAGDLPPDWQAEIAATITDYIQAIDAGAL